MNTQATITSSKKFQQKQTLGLIAYINKVIAREQKNALGITLVYIMVGTGIASITAALSVHEGVSLPILMTSASLAMGTNAAALSQQPFKTTTWFFIVNVAVNSVLLIYQLIILAL